MNSNKTHTFLHYFIYRLNDWCRDWLWKHGYIPTPYVKFKKEVYAVSDVVAEARGVTFTFEK